MAVAIGLFKTHMFTPRYALIGVTGVFLLVPMIAAWLANGRAFAGFLLVCVMVLPLALAVLEVPAHNPLEEESMLVKALGQGPVVVPDGLLFLQMWYYAPAPLKSRLLFLVDSEAAVKYMGFDSIDVGVGNLRPWSPVPAVNYKDYATPGREFRLYQNSVQPGWVLPKVVGEGGSAQIEQYDNYRQLVRVRLKE
jgi:hypothetical protein